MPRSECANCGSELPAKSRFCPECGARIEASPTETAVQEVPPSETGEVPVDRLVAERRLFGIPPSTLLFGIGVAALALAVLMFAMRHWVWGIGLLALAVFVLGGFLTQTRRVPGEASGVARVSAAAIEAVRARAGAAVETVAAHGSARIELARLRRNLSELAAERGGLLRELGEAVYEGNRAATKELKKRLQELDERIQAKEAEMANVASAAQERIEHAQLQVQQTQVAPVAEEPEAPDQPPEPARIPEPFPPPDEGEPPEPARIPEPFPPPDEGDRPRQPDIPEPSPWQDSVRKKR